MLQIQGSVYRQNAQYVVATEIGDDGAEISLDVDIVLVDVAVTSLKLPANPSAGKVVRVCAGAADTPINGNGHTILPGGAIVPKNTALELVFVGGAWFPLSSGAAVPNGSILLWGNAALALASPLQLSPGYSDTIATGFVTHIIAPIPGLIDQMRVHQDAPFGNGGPIAYNLRVNGTTEITASVASTASDGQNLVSIATVLAGDRIDLQVTGANAVAQVPGGITATFRFRPTI